MTIAVRRFFTHNWSVLWATSYTCGVVAFDEYFLGQLRRDDLNVTILADLDKLTETWTATAETSGLSRLRRLNRAYLLRPVAWYRRAFHAKTYASAAEGNVETGVLASHDANSARKLFTPPGLDLRRLEAEEVDCLMPDPRPEASGPPLRLLRCERLADGHLSLAVTPVPASPVWLVGLPADEPAVSLTLAPSGGTALYADLVRARTVDPWESAAPLVQLVDERGVALSNPVPVDDPEALAATLRGRDEEDRGALRDLNWDELDSPAGRILEELQASCFFEPRRAGHKRAAVVTEGQGAESDTSFWQRLGQLDIKAVPLGHRSRLGRSHLASDPIFAQLRALLLQAPHLPELKPIRPSAIPDDELDDPDAARRRWAMVEDLREHGAPAALAQLLFDVLRPERRDRVAVVVEWQPILRAALDLGVVRPTTA